VGSVGAEARTGPDGVLRVRLSGGHDARMLRAVAQSNALALLPAGDGARFGGRVEVLLLDADRLSASPKEPPSVGSTSGGS